MKRHSGLWQYLEQSGVLKEGSDDKIKAAKRTYRKEYILQYKRKQRAKQPEYLVMFKKENGELGRVLEAAKKHKMKVTSFLRAATLGYIQRTYVVPNREQVARLEQLLSDCLNEIKKNTNTKDRIYWNQELKLDAIEKRIITLEEQISEVLRYPPLLSSDDNKNQIT